MSDTQWPRYQVFLQEQEGDPYQDVGSVHAPDPELALLNARDVFVRRPACSGLWVAPVEAIYSRTAQELEEESIGQEEAESSEAHPDPVETESYLVFCKAKAAGTQTLLGDVQANSPQLALKAAREKFSQAAPPFAWWVLPARAVHRSDPEDAASMFDPALHKPFRMATDFHTQTAMRNLMAQKKREG